MTPEMKEVLKVNGLELLEESTLAGFKAFIKALPALVLLTDNKIDDMFIPVLALLEPTIVGFIDEINKADNE